MEGQKVFSYRIKRSSQPKGFLLKGSKLQWEKKIFNIEQFPSLMPQNFPILYSSPHNNFKVSDYYFVAFMHKIIEFSYHKRRLALALSFFIRSSCSAHFHTQEISCEVNTREWNIHELESHVECHDMAFRVVVESLDDWGRWRCCCRCSSVAETCLAAESISICVAFCEGWILQQKQTDHSTTIFNKNKANKNLQ